MPFDETNHFGGGGGGGDDPHHNLKLLDDIGKASIEAGRLISNWSDQCGYCARMSILNHIIMSIIKDAKDEEDFNQRFDDIDYVVKILKEQLTW